MHNQDIQEYDHDARAHAFLFGDNDSWYWDSAARSYVSVEDGRTTPKDLADDMAAWGFADPKLVNDYWTMVANHLATVGVR